jgi:hypothetical protein
MFGGAYGSSCIFNNMRVGRPWPRRWNSIRTAICAEPISSGGGEVDLLGAFGSRSSVPKIQENLRNCPQLPETPFRRESAPPSSTLVNALMPPSRHLLYRFLSNYDEFAHDLDAGRGSH